MPEITELHVYPVKSMQGISLQSAKVTERGRHYRLVQFNRSFQRRVDPADLDGEKAHTAFADGFPFLITSDESLHCLNENLTTAGSRTVPMDRFRPNIVIKGIEPFEENRIRRQTARYKLFTSRQTPTFEKK